MSASNGFVWYDLMTSDVAGSKKFYTELANWKTEKWSGGDYELIKAGDTMVGGIMALTPEQKASGSPPAWVGYVDVDNADATVEKAKKLGGQVYVPPTPIPEIGRFAILADPQGAVFAIIQSARESAPPDRTKLGAFSWAELNTTDYKSAWKFYSELFGWKPTRTMEMGDGMGEYFMFATNRAKPDETTGGMSNVATQMKAPPHWLHYFNVKNADDAAKKVTSLGGKVMNGPMEVPGGDRIAQCMDPQGAAFAFFASGKK